MAAPGFGAMQAAIGSGLVSWLIELLLQIAQAGEILVEARLVLGADLLRHSLQFADHAREHALAHHHARVGFEVFGVRILEVGSEDSGVEVDRRDFGRRRRVGAFVRHGRAHVAGGAGGQGLEPRGAADLVGDRGIERFSRFIAGPRHLARLAVLPVDDPAGVVTEVRIGITKGGQPREQVHVRLDGLPGCDFLGQVVVRAGLLRHEHRLLLFDTQDPRTRCRNAPASFRRWQAPCRCC